MMRELDLDDALKNDTDEFRAFNIHKWGWAEMTQKKSSIEEKKMALEGVVKKSYSMISFWDVDTTDWVMDCSSIDDQGGVRN